MANEAVSLSGRDGVSPFTSSNESQGLPLSASHPSVHHTQIYTWFVNPQNSVAPGDSLGLIIC